MRLYNNQLSGNCWKARQILAHRGIEYERVELDVFDRSKRPEILGGKNPALRVPTLELDDGECLAESNAILWYLADGSEYLPEAPLDRARVLQWMFFEQYELEPSIATARFWIALMGAKEQYLDRARARSGAPATGRSASSRAISPGREWLVGDAYSAADISIYGYTHVAGEGEFDLSQYPSVQAWVDRVTAVPGHVAMSD